MDVSHPHDTAGSPATGDPGIRIAGRGSSARPAMYRAFAILLIVACATLLALRIRHAQPAADDTDARNSSTASVDDDTAGNGESSGAGAPSPAPRAAALTIGNTRVPDDDVTRYIPKDQPPPKMGEVIDRLHKAGVHTGLGAFNPPGTSPPLVGIAVPDDFVLPPGYVRHAQATDDGQRIEPILMFSPDAALRDATGQPIPLPDNRVVPPELAPPGLPIRLIRIPPPREPGFPTY